MHSDIPIVLVLIATVILRLAVVVVAVYLLLPRGPVCRTCETEMARIQNRFLAQVLPFIERRWCLTCGWSGVVRRGPVLPGPTARTPQPSPPSWE